VRLHDDAFLRGERAGFEEHLVGEAEFADVVQVRAFAERFFLVGVQREALGEAFCEGDDTGGVAGTLEVARFEGEADGVQGARAGLVDGDRLDAAFEGGGSPTAHREAETAKAHRG